MSALLKTLNEQRGAELKKAQEITSKLESEKRGFTDEERAEIRGINDKVEKIDEDIKQEVRYISNLSRNAPDLSRQDERDIRSFDWSKMLNHLHRNLNGNSTGPLDGVEAEIVQAGETERRAAGIQGGGLFLPEFFVRREARDLTATGTTTVAGDQGGMTIATEKRGLLDDFYANSVLIAAGATLITGLTGNLDLPRLVAVTAATGKAENANADEVSPTTAMLSLSPKRLPAFVDISERLLMQSSAAIQTVVTNSLRSQSGSTMERAFFHGTGTNEANGIAGTAGIGSVAGGANGAAPTYLHLVSLEEAVDSVNALLGKLRYFSNGQIRKKLKTTLENPAGTDATWILGKDGMVNGYQADFTNAISRTLTKGTSAGVASAIFFGNAEDYVIGQWGGVSLELIRDTTNAIAGMYRLVTSTYYDGGVIRPKSFAAMLDALGA